MRAENELNDATAADERNPFATPERVAESADGWEFADAPPTVGPSFRGAFWYCLRRPFDFKSRANRTEYFGWLAGLAVALFALGFVAGLGTLVPFAWARATKGIPFVFLGAGLTFGLATSVPDAAVWTRRLRDRNVGASWKTALGGYVAILAAAGGVAFGAYLFDSRGAAPNEITGVVIVAAAGATFFLVTSSPVGWGTAIWTTGFVVATRITTPELAEKTAAMIFIGCAVVTLGFLIRVLTGLRAGTPGPNRFGAERLTPKEAARRERDKNAEDGLNVESETV
ncbi:MAG: DUF805 domain-containing protein [Thermoguttaceae bacterium]|nr:DUF805 domain-containing protein [Thermoguttaceae bacterium]